MDKLNPEVAMQLHSALVSMVSSPAIFSNGFRNPETFLWLSSLDLTKVKPENVFRGIFTMEGIINHVDTNIEIDFSEEEDFALSVKVKDAAGYITECVIGFSVVLGATSIYFRSFSEACVWGVKYSDTKSPKIDNGVVPALLNDDFIDIEVKDQLGETLRLLVKPDCTESYVFVNNEYVQRGMETKPNEFEIREPNNAWLSTVETHELPSASIERRINSDKRSNYYVARMADGIAVSRDGYLRYYKLGKKGMIKCLAVKPTDNYHVNSMEPFAELIEVVETFPPHEGKRPIYMKMALLRTKDCEPEIKKENPILGLKEEAINLESVGGREERRLGKSTSSQDFNFDECVKAWISLCELDLAEFLGELLTVKDATLRKRIFEAVIKARS